MLAEPPDLTPVDAEGSMPTLPAQDWGDFDTALRQRDQDAPSGPSEWALVVYAGAHLGKVFPLHFGGNLIGRSATASIPLMDEEVSRHHAMVDMTLEPEGVRLMVTDMFSTNGTLLNGEPLNVLCRVGAGDRISMGSHVLKVVAMDPLERAFHLTLLEQSTRDPLTGLGNREAVLSEMQNRFELSMRHGRPLSAVIVDLDHFKQVNDRHGHAAGDLALRQFGELVRQVLRSTDLSGRIGGEEFLLVLPETELEGAHLLVERLRTAVETNPVRLSTGPLQVTASFGVGERHERDRDAGALMGRVDAALYRAKHLGRNRIAFADPPR
jgi:two-component system, cell cycle response regulator